MEVLARGCGGLGNDSVTVRSPTLARLVAAAAFDRAMMPRESIVRLELSRSARNTQSEADDVRAAFKAAGVEFSPMGMNLT